MDKNVVVFNTQRYDRSLRDLERNVDAYRQYEIMVRSRRISIGILRESVTQRIQSDDVLLYDARSEF